MTEPCLLDNDIVLKMAAFQLYRSFVELFTVDGKNPAMLGVGQFVVRKKATKGKRFQDTEAVVNALEELLAQIIVIEPNEKEIELAADFEVAALNGNLAFDTGEAQLLAVLINRSGPGLVTGDKRAIAAAASLNVAQARERLICLEQVFSCLVANEGADALRICVCKETATDRTLSICFSCASLQITAIHSSDVLAALSSYITDLRKKSGEMLMTDEKVSALTA